MIRRPPRSTRTDTLFPYTTLFRSIAGPSPQAGSFNVTANVVASCKVTSTTDIAFGNYDPADANNTTALDAAGSIAVRCVKGTAANVAIEQGANPAAGSSCITPLRQMAGGTERLNYAIYQDAARTTVWGCDTTNEQRFTAATLATPTTDRKSKRMNSSHY